MSNRAGVPNHPYHEWLNGEMHVLVQGLDFKGVPAYVASNVRKAVISRKLLIDVTLRRNSILILPRPENKALMELRALAEMGTSCHALDTTISRTSSWRPVAEQSVRDRQNNHPDRPLIPVQLF